jgi:hypothetical protein
MLNVVYIMLRGENHEGGSIQGVFGDEGVALSVVEDLIALNAVEVSEYYQDRLVREQEVAQELGVAFNRSEFEKDIRGLLWKPVEDQSIRRDWEGKPKGLTYKGWVRDAEWLVIEAHEVQTGD